jgi:hypothetical protein
MRKWASTPTGRYGASLEVADATQVRCVTPYRTHILTFAKRNPKKEPLSCGGMLAYCDKIVSLRGDVMDGQSWLSVTPRIRVRDILGFLLVSTYLSVVYLFLFATRQLPSGLDVKGRVLGAARFVVRLPRAVARRLIRVPRAVTRLFRGAPAGSEGRRAA